MALRQLADDVREHFARLRMRHQTTGNTSTTSRRRGKIPTQLPRPTSTDGSQDESTSGTDDRTETPDLIRPAAGRTASLPPLPPAPSLVVGRQRLRRRTSVYLRPVATVAAMGHIYEEIPPTPPPPPPPPPLPQEDHQSSSSSSSAGGGDSVGVVRTGRVYYVSPLDGALCRICPMDDRAIHRRQLVCVHVQRHHDELADRRPTSPPIDVNDIATSGLTAVRGRELRLCAACCHQLRSTVAGDVMTGRDYRQKSTDSVSPLTPSSYNSCDLSLLNVPCYYWSTDASSGDNVQRADALSVSNKDTQQASADTVCNDVTNNVKNSIARSNSSSTDMQKPSFGQSGSAFTKIGVRRSSTDEGLLAASNSLRHSGRRPGQCRLSGDQLLDERRRPLRHADDTLLAVLDSVRQNDFRSYYLHLCDGNVVARLPGEREGCVKSTSCADFRSPRRRSLALRRRSEDVGRRRRMLASSGVVRDGGDCTSQSSIAGSASESSLGRSEVKSVYYNGLLASMIDLTAAYDRASVDDRLSCRATSGPRGSLRTSSQQPTTLAEPQQCGGFPIHRSSGDLMLGSVQ